MIDEQKAGLLVGMIGWSSENIKQGKSGWCWFPTGPEDTRYRFGFKWQKAKVTATEDVRAYRDVVVLDDINNIKEHTPVETKPMGYVYDDFVQQAFTTLAVKYDIGSEAYNADNTLPSRFMAEYMFLEPSQDCWVRFDTNSRVEHFLAAGIQYEYWRRCRVIWVRRDTLDGTLTVRAFGNEVGV